MKRLTTLLFFCILSLLPLVAQKGMRKGDFCFEDYPKVSFLWHENNPEEMSSAQFVLKEGGDEVNLKVRTMQTPLPKHKSIVVLWEDMYSGGELMFEFSRGVILDFIASKDEEDDVKIAVFNRHHGTDKVLKFLTDNFTSDAEQLKKAVREYRHSTETFREQPLLSDVFPAINESFDCFQQGNDTKEVRALIVITSGQPIEVAATNHVVSVQNNSLDRHIPIYVLQYSPRHGPSTKFESLAHDTYGMYYSCSSINLNVNIANGSNALQEFYKSMPVRYAGVDYELSYKTKCKRGKVNQEFTLSVCDVEHNDSFVSPSHTFASWVEEYLLWFIVIIVVFLALVTAAIVVPIKVKKKRRIERETHERRAEELRQQMISQENARREEAERQRKEQEEMKHNEIHFALQQLIRTKNNVPVIQYETCGQMSYFQMNDIVVTIGRENSDILLQDGTVSRKHATIRFTGDGFILEDHSTNGTLVNGTLLKNNAISITNGSKFEIGNVLLKFCF